MKKHLVFAFLAVLFAVVPGAIAKTTVSGIITMDVDLSHQAKGKEVQLWIPYPVTDADQNIAKVKISGNFVESAVYTDKVFKTPMLYARWDKNAASRNLTFSFHAEREEVIRRDFPSHEAAWDPGDYALYLAPTRLGPLDGEVKKLADKITKGKQGVLAKAKAIYDWTVENTYRNPDTRGCGMGDVFRLLQDPGGKCADISSIYVALARAAGVPSREVFGIRMGKKASQDITTWQHCWAEFYLPGYGWVPVDPADVRKMMLVEKLPLDAPKTMESRQYFWGGIDAYRVKLGEGRDLVLNPPRQGEPVNYLMYPFAQAGDTTIDWLEPTAFTYKITFHQKQKAEDGYGLIDTDSLKQLLDSGVAVTVVDARNPEEYQEVHVKGAINIPENFFPDYVDQLPAAKSARIVFYCNGSKCGKSKKAAKLAAEKGYDNVYVYSEGLPVWEEKGLPIYAGPDYEKRIETTKIAPGDLDLLIKSGCSGGRIF